MSNQPDLLRVTPTVVLPSMNKTEAAYAQHLELQRRLGEIYTWWFQAVRLCLADGTFYTPDFRVWHNDGTVEHIEVKGFLREAARVRFNVACEMHPMYRWRMVIREGGLKHGRWVDWADRKRKKKGDGR